MNKFNFVKKVSKQDKIKCLKDTMKKNAEAIDYVEECLNIAKDRLSYNENDVQSQIDKEQLEYIKFTLYYLDKMYMKSFRTLGGKL